MTVLEIDGEDMVSNGEKKVMAVSYIRSPSFVSCTVAWTSLIVPGQEIDGPMNGPAPAPWSIQCTPSEMFQDEVHELEVPHTSHVIVRGSLVQELSTLSRAYTEYSFLWPPPSLPKEYFE